MSFGEILWTFEYAPASAIQRGVVVDAQTYGRRAYESGSGCIDKRCILSELFWGVGTS